MCVQRASVFSVHTCAPGRDACWKHQLYITLHAGTYRDCQDAYSRGRRDSGVYTIRPSKQAFKAYCDMSTDNGGWTVFQRRKDGSVDFYRNWDQYVNGFGDLNGSSGWVFDTLMKSPPSHLQHCVWIYPPAIMLNTVLSLSETVLQSIHCPYRDTVVMPAMMGLATTME